MNIPPPLITITQVCSVYPKTGIKHAPKCSPTKCLLNSCKKELYLEKVGLGLYLFFGFQGPPGTGPHVLKVGLY